jgi:hypothetical protein
LILSPYKDSNAEVDKDTKIPYVSLKTAVPSSVFSKLQENVLGFKSTDLRNSFPPAFHFPVPVGYTTSF